MLLGFVHNQAQLSRESTHTAAATLYNRLIYLALLADTQSVHVMKYALCVTLRFSGTEAPGEDRLRIFSSCRTAIKLSVEGNATAVPQSHEAVLF